MSQELEKETGRGGRDRRNYVKYIRVEAKEESAYMTFFKKPGLMLE